MLSLSVLIVLSVLSREKPRDKRTEEVKYILVMIIQT